MPRKVTSFDVARLAGVSQPTVSRALRNLPGTSPGTRERVLEAARELAYVTSDRGRSLSMRSTQRIAIVSEELTNPYYPELVEPLRRELAHRGYRTVLVADHADGNPVGLDALTDGSYDGVILTTTRRRSPLPRDLTERGVPHVLANRLLDQPEASCCGIDNAAGARQVSDLLAALGHERIGVIQGPVDTSTGKERAEGLAAGLRGHGIGVRRELTRQAPYTHDAGRAAAHELLRLGRPPTAIVCGNDVVALGVLSAARERGISVPVDLTVIGFDDIPMAGWPLVALTTVHCDLQALARMTVELLMDRLENPDRAPVERRIRPSLVLRGTHAAVRGDGRVPPPAAVS